MFAFIHVETKLNTETAKFCIFPCYYTTTESRLHSIRANRKNLLFGFF